MRPRNLRGAHALEEPQQHRRAQWLRQLAHHAANALLQFGPRDELLGCRDIGRARMGRSGNGDDILAALSPNTPACRHARQIARYAAQQKQDPDALIIAWMQESLRRADAQRTSAVTLSADDPLVRLAGLGRRNLRCG